MVGAVEPSESARRSAARYFGWLVSCQRGQVALGVFYGNAWMIVLTLAPYVLSRAIDDGLVPGNYGALVTWSAALLGVGVLDAWLGIMRYRTMNPVGMDGSLRTVRVLVGQTVRLGAALQRRSAGGEV